MEIKPHPNHYLYLKVAKKLTYTFTDGTDNVSFASKVCGNRTTKTTEGGGPEN